MMYGNSDFDWHEDENNQIRARAEVYRKEQQEETIRKLKTKVALLEKALAEQPAQQEPVAWQVMVEDCAMKEFSTKDAADEWCVREKLSGSSYAYWIRPLYTRPQAREPLTDDEFQAIKDSLFGQQGWDGEGWDLALKKAIEAKLKEKNT